MIAGDRLMQNQTRQTKKFSETVEVSKETVFGRGGVGNLSRRF